MNVGMWLFQCGTNKFPGHFIIIDTIKTYSQARMERKYTWLMVWLARDWHRLWPRQLVYLFVAHWKWSNPFCWSIRLQEICPIWREWIDDRYDWSWHCPKTWPNSMEYPICLCDWCRGFSGRIDSGWCWRCDGRRALVRWPADSRLGVSTCPSWRQRRFCRRQNDGGRSRVSRGSMYGRHWNCNFILLVEYYRWWWTNHTYFVRKYSLMDFLKLSEPMACSIIRSTLAPLLYEMLSNTEEISSGVFTEWVMGRVESSESA